MNENTIKRDLGVIERYSNASGGDGWLANLFGVGKTQQEVKQEQKRADAELTRTLSQAIQQTVSMPERKASNTPLYLAGGVLLVLGVVTVLVLSKKQQNGK